MLILCGEHHIQIFNKVLKHEVSAYMSVHMLTCHPQLHAKTPLSYLEQLTEAKGLSQFYEYA